MNTGQIISLVSLIVITLVVIGMDIYLALDKYKDNTFTAIIQSFSRKAIIVPYLVGFVMGLLAGHFYWT